MCGLIEQEKPQIVLFGHQFEAHLGGLAALVLDIYEYVVHLLCTY